MKYLKEVIYLFKNAGFSIALTYIIYRLKLKLQNTKYSSNRRNRQTSRMQKINEHLFNMNHKVVEINNKRLLEIIEKENTIYVRPFSSDRRVSYQIFDCHEYLPVVKIFDQLFSHPPQLIFDLGANIGLTSVYFSKFYPKSTIVAIEPFPDNAELAQINMAKNNFFNFKIIKGGIWNKNTNLSLNRNFRDGKEWSINLTENILGEIKGYSLSDIFETYNQPIDILKIDIEGAERELFSEISYSSRFLPKVKIIAIEIHDEFNCRQMIYDAFRKSNFIYYESGETTIGINKQYINLDSELFNSQIEKVH